METRDIAVLIGSLREGSYNRKIAKALKAFAPERLTLREVRIGDLPFYNEDIEKSPPESWTRFRDEIRGADGIVFVTPEYNRSVPAALKNAIDVGSRPYGKSVWAGKPAGIVSVSMGGIGGFGANHHLRQSLVFLDMPVLQQPEAYIGNAANLMDDAGEITNAGTRDVLTSFINAYAAWVERLAA